MDRRAPNTSVPKIATVGLTGVLVSFGDVLSEAANRAALAFRAAVDGEIWGGIEETATSLTSVFVRFDPLVLDLAALTDRLTQLAEDRDWFATPLPSGRRHWCIPLVLGGDAGPQFEEAAGVAGLSLGDARDQIAAARVRVMTIGFAPGQPYMGELGTDWDIPRMTALNPRVPEGALVVAIRQLIIFSRATPTGWRHIGQTAFRAFRPEANQPFAFSPGDEVSFRLVVAEALEELRVDDRTGDGGATVEVLE